MQQTRKTFEVQKELSEESKGERHAVRGRATTNGWSRCHCQKQQGTQPQKISVRVRVRESERERERRT